MPRRSAPVALASLAIALALAGCSGVGDLEALAAAGSHDERANATCSAAFPDGLVGDDNLVATRDSTVASVRKLASTYSAKDDAALNGADSDEYAAICVISGDLVREGKTTSNLAIYVLDGADQRGELAAF